MRGYSPSQEIYDDSGIVEDAHLVLLEIGLGS